MKCRYKYCKCGGEVDKDEAIKEGNSYYHKTCIKEKQLKQDIEDYYLSNMPQATLQILRKVIKQLIHDKGMSAEYVLYVLKYISNNHKPINNPFGLINYCNDKRISDLFEKQITINKYKKIKEQKEEIIEIREMNFTYKKPNTKWTDLL